MVDCERPNSALRVRESERETIGCGCRSAARRQWWRCARRANDRRQLRDAWRYTTSDRVTADEDDGAAVDSGDEEREDGAAACCDADTPAKKMHVVSDLGS